jgi:hypothetical protein
MTWTDKRGVTHEVLTYTDEEGDVRVRTDGPVTEDLESFGWRAWMRCRVRASPGDRESRAPVDCMTCLVKGSA